MTDDRTLDELLLVWFSHHEAGRDVSPEEVCRDRPDLLPALRARVSGVLRVESVSGRLGASTVTAPAGPPPHLFDVATILSRSGVGTLGWLGDRFRAVRVLGCGAMGAVLAAEDSRPRRLIALKVMRPDLTDLARGRARFVREARAAAAVLHDNLMPVFEADELNGVPYLVMPLFGGETLAGRLARGPLPLPELARLGRHLSLGLSVAHAAGIVHRDLKPSNVWLEDLPDADGPVSWRARVMDFGLALDLREVDRLTASGLLVGTPDYMSPEQADDHDIGPASDLFSLGVLLYEAATGLLPFGRHRALVTLLNAIVDRGRPASAEPLRDAGLPPPLSALILRLLSKDVAGRPARAADVAAEIRHIEKAHA